MAAPCGCAGGIELTGADGKPYEIRNRMTLCRCGRSENKPFCNGAHEGCKQPVLHRAL